MTDTEPIYRNDQDPIKQLQNMPDVSSLFTERERCNLKASVTIAHSKSGNFKGKGGWNGRINFCGSDCQLRPSASKEKIRKKRANVQELIPPI